MAVELPYILEAIAAILKLNLDEVQAGSEGAVCAAHTLKAPSLEGRSTLGLGWE